MQKETGIKKEIEKLLKNKNFRNNQNYTFSEKQYKNLKRYTDKIVYNGLNNKKEYLKIDKTKIVEEYNSFMVMFFIYMFLFIIPMFVFYILKYNSNDGRKMGGLIFLFSIFLILPLIHSYLPTRKYEIFFDNDFLIIKKEKSIRFNENNYEYE